MNLHASVEKDHRRMENIRFHVNLNRYFLHIYSLFGECSGIFIGAIEILKGKKDRRSSKK